MMRMLFGVDIDSDESPPFDENLLATNPVPAIWLTSDVSSLPEPTVTKFVFHAPLKRAAVAEREEAIRAQLKELRLPKSVATEILKLDGVSSAQLQSALRASRLVEKTSRAKRARAPAGDQAQSAGACQGPQRALQAVRDALFAGVPEARIETIEPHTREEWEKRLLFMKHLTPGDFATVKRQCLILATELTPEGWLEQLEIECEIKSAVPSARARYPDEHAA